MHKPKLLIIGHARHGKDTVAEMLRDDHGYHFVSSSIFVGQEVLWDNWGVAVYPTFEDMFADRVNNRKLWADMITAYNTPDPTRTATTMFKRGFDLYVGMRRRTELDACNAVNLFDCVVWVDRTEHLPDEPYESMEFVPADADVIIDNNGTLADLALTVAAFAEAME